jgi:MoxR-like ATPase
MENQTQETINMTDRWNQPEASSYSTQEILSTEKESQERQSSRLSEWKDLSEAQMSAASAGIVLDQSEMPQSDFMTTTGTSQTQMDFAKETGVAQTQTDFAKSTKPSGAGLDLKKSAGAVKTQSDITKPAKPETSAKTAASSQSAAKDKKTGEMQRAAQLIINELKKVIVGKDEILKKVLMVILAGGHILLEDVPGVGKTTLALGLSKALNLNYRRIQFTPDTMASDIVGFSVYNKETGGLDYKPGAALCNLFLADEINRTSAKTQAALLEVMEEGGMTVDGVTHKIPEPFVCIATQNPLGSAGTQKLPDSQLDRFMVRLSIGYPDLQSQVNIIKQRQLKDPLETVRALASAAHIKTMKRGVQMVRMTDEIIEYAASLCEKTRSMEAVEQGVSPRAVLALVQMAKAAALMDGRDYAIPQDVKEVFIDVCAHRLILTARAKIRKETEEKILQQVLKEVKPPAILERKGK